MYLFFVRIATSPPKPESNCRAVHDAYCRGGVSQPAASPAELAAREGVERNAIPVRTLGEAEDDCIDSLVLRAIRTIMGLHLRCDCAPVRGNVLGCSRSMPAAALSPPMLTEPQQLVRQIHQAGTRFVIACTGGGSGAIAQLLEVPGASQSILAAVVPYGDAALADWLGGRPDQSCAASTARAMAMAAFCQARRYDEAAPKLAGLGCTASLATDRPKRGPHRVHLAAQTADATITWSLELTKGHRSRSEEELLSACLFLNLAAETAGLSDPIVVRLLEGEEVQRSNVVAPEPWRDLIMGRTVATPLGHAPIAHVSPAAVFPGAFRPLHAGHRRMAQIAWERLGVPVQFEISVFNVDKPPLDYWEIDARVRQFDAGQTLWLTRTPTFLEKSRQFPGATFVVGADTLRRIAEPRYYGNDPSACQHAIERIVDRGCRFLVFGRVEGERFVSLAELNLPDALRAACQEVPADVFRDDTSSTDLRRRDRDEGSGIGD